MLRCIITGGISSYPEGALDLLKSGKPEQGSLRHDAGSNKARRPMVAVKNRKMRFHPSTHIPAPRTLRELRKEEPMPIVTKH
eukprot:906910-Pyramimonas_sp.AAC.2